MTERAEDCKKIRKLIEQAHTALLVTVGEDGELDSRPMGRLQSFFDDTLWFLTFRDAPKVKEIGRDNRVLVCFANPSDYDYVSLSGRAELVDDKDKLKELWVEGLRVWFPGGPGDPNLALLAVRVDEAKYWTNAASVVRYAWAYVRAVLTHKGPKAAEIGENKSVRFQH
jgi:general stress protein 26